ncbi:MAG TPA: hypothetical protein VNG90_03010 [Candidatus Acidoferrum sp.]|nr:hypothetical protein [Candidatus Acidoferrum sp.]
MLVTLDGPSGIGKTTLTEMLAKKLEAKAIPAIAVHTPTKSDIGQLARNGTYSFNAHTLSCLAAADRYHNDTDTVRPALEKGTVVICDRYIPSSLVLDSLDGVEPGFTWGLYQAITMPTLSLLLFGSPELCLQRATMRGNYSRFHAQDVSKEIGEMERFRVVCAWLQDNTTYPVRPFDIGTKSANEVADDLIEIILSSKGAN